MMNPLMISASGNVWITSFPCQRICRLNLMSTRHWEVVVEATEEGVVAVVEEEEVVGTAVAVVDVVEGAGQETEVSSLF
ncbi:hypothetical protein Vadar_018179 [Vaccinium darrowii]|uniref:Uncharacterized protein n=1 Tax=Vaccinium darrowii TaxID=229202 RepID=A0ACB7XIA3_9ERIC|nr:hypothetical protein Vadar_018179 [Vaccinium darrowii]